VGWLEHIIFAMAPLGILTAIVSAIRVGGPSWLRAVIGRARENRAMVEMELMSSTSHEVCELCNGQGIIRTMGKPEIRQIVYLEELKADEKTFGLYTVETALKDGHLTSERACVESMGSAKAAPNISLNLYSDSKTSDLCWVALCGIFLQSGMLVFSAFTVYHSGFSWRFPLNDNRVMSYAFPIMATGTIFLVGGMLICSAVVEHSTEEKKFVARRTYKEKTQEKELNARILWLQQKHVVSDQAFDSFVIFGRNKSNPSNYILSSRRNDGNQSTDVLSKWLVVLATGKIASTNSEAFTVLGLMRLIRCADGQGLRGLNWTSSIAMLVCVCLMTFLRAMVRRGLIVTPVSKKVPDKHEMDWLALRMV
ncbi:hypothetical protein K440DRAFT_562474, partial [Wilcoxina mikolae CBS 423.85]